MYKVRFCTSYNLNKLAIYKLYLYRNEVRRLPMSGTHDIWVWNEYLLAYEEQIDK